MPIVPAPELIRTALQEGYALPAINVANMETVQGVAAAAEEIGSPIIFQISPGAIAYAGYETIRALAFAAAQEISVPAVVHLDHCREPETVRRALADGFGSVMFDGSRLDYSENVSLTRALVSEARPLGVAVEAELGYIGGIEDTTLEQAQAAVTSAQEAADFVAATDVDILAPAIGSLHRMPADSVQLDVEAIRLVALACARPLALHGGSGVSRSQLPGLISAGVAKVNISSQVSRALATGIRSTWQANALEMDLRRYLAAGREEVKRLAAEYMLLCGSAGRAAARQPVAAAELSEPE